jgi:hypothetical protein
MDLNGPEGNLDDLAPFWLTSSEVLGLHLYEPTGQLPKDVTTGKAPDAVGDLIHPGLDDPPPLWPKGAGQRAPLRSVESILQQTLGLTGAPEYGMGRSDDRGKMGDDRGDLGRLPQPPAFLQGPLPFPQNHI